MSAALSPAEMSRIIGLLSMLSSDYEGERANAGLMVSRMLKAKGVQWKDLIQPAVAYTPQPAPKQHWQPPQEEWRDLLTKCMKYHWMLSGWEREFCGSIDGRHCLTTKQSECLDRIVAKLQDRGVKI